MHGLGVAVDVVAGGPSKIDDDQSVFVESGYVADSFSPPAEFVQQPTGGNFDQIGVGKHGIVGVGIEHLFGGIKLQFFDLGLKFGESRFSDKWVFKETAGGGGGGPIRHFEGADFNDGLGDVTRGVGWAVLDRR